MKRIIKIVVIVIIIYAILVLMEAVRLRYFYKQTLIKPLITISEEENEDLTREKFEGIGYSVTYYCNPTFYSNDNVQNEIYGAEFRVFDKLLIWAWIE